MTLDLVAGGGVATAAQPNHRSYFLRALLAIHSARDIVRIERFVQNQRQAWLQHPSSLSRWWGVCPPLCQHLAPCPPWHPCPSVFAQLGVLPQSKDPPPLSLGAVGRHPTGLPPTTPACSELRLGTDRLLPKCSTTPMEYTDASSWSPTLPRQRGLLSLPGMGSSTPGRRGCRAGSKID